MQNDAYGLYAVSPEFPGKDQLVPAFIGRAGHGVRWRTRALSVGACSFR
jgi:hypothetical protein